MRLKDKICIITGGANGIGAACAHTFAREGAKVVVADIHAPQETLDALFVEADVSNKFSAERLVSTTLKRHGRIDVLVNNAGITQVLPISLLEESDWDLVMDVNVKGAYLFSRAALKAMIRQKAGHILNIGNFASERVIEAPVHYAASKAALRGFTEALAREVGRYAVQVNLLAPGLLDVGMAQGLPQHRQKEYLQQSAAGRLGRAAEIAEIAAFMVSGENRFMTGAKLVADGGL